MRACAGEKGVEDEQAMKPISAGQDYLGSLSKRTDLAFHVFGDHGPTPALDSMS